MASPLKFSPSLGAQAGAAATKTDFAAAVNAGLGLNRIVRCFYDPDGGADPASSGTEFLVVGATGTLQAVSGNISYLGKLSGATKQIPVDLATGSAALRMEGNNEWVEGSLGLPNADTLFHLTENIAAGKGFAFSKGAGIKAPALLDSGTGPFAPAITTDMVAGFRLCDYASGSRVVVGTAMFSQREPNLVLQHAWMAREMGDVRRMRVPDGGGLVLGVGDDAFIFAGDSLIAHKSVNGEDTNKPLQEVEIRCAPYGRWASYPFRRDFRIGADITIPQAHKIELIDGNGNIVDVIEMYSTRDADNTPGSGWPVNDSRMTQDWSVGRLMPHWNCAQTHQWRSHKARTHSQMLHFLPGVDADSVAPNNVAKFASDPEQWPMITGNFLTNGLGSYNVSPKWSRAKDGGADTAIIDTNFDQLARDNWITQAVGYGYEPAVPGKHVHYMAPGGSRNDRAGWPHCIVKFVTTPNGNRIHGNVPWRDMVHHWMLNYANHSVHYFTDVYKGHGIPKDRILAGETCFNDTYYNGGNENFRPNLDMSAIRLLTMVNAQHDNPYRDKYGRRFFGEYARDLQHNQSNAAVGAYITLSPRAVLQARHFFAAAITAAFDISQSFKKDNFMTRQHAWLNWQFVNTWIVANEHPDGFTKDEIEGMWARHLTQMYDAVHPEYVAQTSVFGITLKTLGMPFFETGNGTTITLAPISDSKSFYFGQVLLLMKQSGALASMKAYSQKVSDAIDFLFTCLTKYAVDATIDSNGRIDRMRTGSPLYFPDDKWTYPEAGPRRLPANWGEYYYPDGQLDWIHMQDGTIGGSGEAVDLVNTKHFRAQHLNVVNDFAPEYKTARFDQALALMDGWYAAVAANVAAGGPQWSYRFAMMGKFNAPAVVGPLS